MNKTLVIAKWEFLEKAKTKAFIISFFLTPLLIGLFSYLPGKLIKEEDDTPKVIGILDSSMVYIQPLIEKVEKHKLINNQPRYILINLFNKEKSIAEIKKDANNQILKEKIKAYIHIDLLSNDSIVFEFRSKNLAKFQDAKRIEDAFNQVRRELEFTKLNIDKKTASRISKVIDLKEITVEEEGKESKTDFMSKFWSSYAFIIMMMVLILGTGGMLVRSLVEEKSNRLIEIIVSSCRPNDILLGKILGLSCLVMFQVFVWVILAIAFLGQTILLLISLNNLILILIYFCLGFVFYTSIFVGFGSIVTTEQEAQQLTGYLSMIIIFPVAIAIPAMQNPDLTIVKFLTYIPFTMPAIMIFKINSGQIPIYELIATILILVGSIYLTVLISSKVFRIGILSYGKRPKLKEIVSWIKSS